MALVPAPSQLWNSRLCSPHLQWPWMWDPLSCSFLSVQPPHQPTMILLSCELFSPLFWSLPSLYHFSPPWHTSFSPFHSYFSTILPSFLTHNIPFQTSPQGILSHWNSSAGKNDWAHQTQLNLCLGTSFPFLSLSSLHAAGWGDRDMIFLPICWHTLHAAVLLSCEPPQCCSKIKWLRQGIQWICLPCFLETWKPKTCSVENGWTFLHWELEEGRTFSQKISVFYSKMEM